MNTEKKNRPWKGYFVLILLLIILSIIAFILTSIEGFVAGVIVIFIGFVLSFFRDDLKLILGLAGSARQPTPTVVEDKATLTRLRELEKEIVKRREKLQKAISKYEEKEKPEKKPKYARQVVEEATSLMARLDQARWEAARAGNENIAQHYVVLLKEIEATREAYIRLSREHAE